MTTSCSVMFSHCYHKQHVFISVFLFPERKLTARNGHTEDEQQGRIESST